MSFKDWMIEGLKEEAEKKREKAELKKALKKEEKQRIKELKKQGVAMCPKCNSQSLQYVERRKLLSLGRAAVGGVLLGPLGAGIGAVTSKKRKGYIKCLNCGHMWKK